MKQGLMIFIAIGAIGIYFLLGFLNKVQSTDNLSTVETRLLEADKKHYRQDAIGQTVLVFGGESYQEKFEIWKRSPLHAEFMDLFPKFMVMQDFIKDRILDTVFREELSKKVDIIETEYLSGKISDMQAKEKLDNY
jgi:hypothetical protein